jgi:hypothetical protein
MKRNSALVSGLFLTMCGMVPIAAAASSAQGAVSFKLEQKIGPEFVTTVDYKDQRFIVPTLLADYEANPDSVEADRRMSGWKDGFLFIKQRCGGTAWRCVVDQVFTLNADKLVHLGEVESGACQALGCAYADGAFADLFDAMPVNPVTGMKDAPPLRVQRIAQGAALSTSIEKTWAINDAQYKAAIACLELTAAAGFGKPCADKLQPWSALVYAAKLTHYTSRAQEWNALFSTLAPAYCKHSLDPRCAARVDGLKNYVSRLAPGAKPLFVPFRIRETSVSNASATATNQPESLGPANIIKLKM